MGAMDVPAGLRPFSAFNGALTLYAPSPADAQAEAHANEEGQVYFGKGAITLEEGAPRGGGRRRAIVLFAARAPGVPRPRAARARRMLHLLPSQRLPITITDPQATSSSTSAPTSARSRASPRPPSARAALSTRSSRCRCWSRRSRSTAACSPSGRTAAASPSRASCRSRRVRACGWGEGVV